MLNRSSILNITLIVPYIPDGLILVFQNKKLDHSLGTVFISHSTPPQKDSIRLSVYSHMYQTNHILLSVTKK